MDEQLITNSIDCSEVVNVELIFGHNFVHYQNEIADVDICVNGGQWQNLLRYTGTDTEEEKEINLSVYADGQSDVQLRWHYYNARYEWYWGIDNVRITGEQIVTTIAGDFEPDCDVDFADFGMFASAWLIDANNTNWDSAFDISEPNDNVINEKDLEVLVRDWLAGTP